MGTKTWEKIDYFASVCGILGPLLMGAGILISVVAYVGIEGQSYGLMNHFVSELGELGVSEMAVVFNWGLILGGSLTTIFMVYLASQIDHWTKYPLGIMSVFATINGALVGVYPMNFLEPHIQVAMRFFNLGMLISFLYSLLFLFSRWHPFPRWMAAPGLFNAVSFTWFLNFPSDINSDVSFDEGMSTLLTNRPDFIPMALLEWIVILGILVWVLMLGCYLLLNKSIRSKLTS